MHVLVLAATSACYSRYLPEPKCSTWQQIIFITSACSNTEVPVCDHAISPSRPSFHFHQRLTYYLYLQSSFSSSSITNNTQLFLAIATLLFSPYPTNTRCSLSYFFLPVSHLDCSATRTMLRIRHALITQLNLGLFSLSLELCHPP